MKVLAEWLDLKINKYEDGKFLAYEALSNEQCESANWDDIVEFVEAQVAEIGDEIAKEG